MLTTLFIFIIVLGVMVFFHELGHFWTARKFGVKTDEFGFGLPPRICGWKKINGKRKFFWGNEDVEKSNSEDTVYSLNWIPLGGFVKIKGENGEDKQDQDSFVSKKIWQRLVIISAGVVMNVFLTFVCLTGAYLVGAPTPVDENTATPESFTVQIMEVKESSPAKEAGLQPGDTILRLDGQPFTKMTEIQSYLAGLGKSSVEIEVSRFGEEKKFTVMPEYSEELGRSIIGIGMISAGIVKYPWYQAVWLGFKGTGYLFVEIISGFAGIIKNLVADKPIGVDVAGPIGIASLTGQVAKMGFVYLLQFMALLSMNLAIINFLPLPALDGGRALFLIVEKIRGKAINEKVERVVHGAGFFLLMMLFVVVTSRDIFKFKNTFINLWNSLFH